jgi:hypothetical protein
MARHATERMKRPSIVVVALVALFVGSAALCLGLLGPPLWTLATTKLMPTQTTRDAPALRPKAALKPFGAILADQAGTRAGDKLAR